MANELTLAMKLLLDSRQFVNGMIGSRGAVTRFTGGVKAELSALRNSFNTVQGKLAAVGVGFGAVATAVQSAQMDKSLTQIQLTAGAGATEVEQLRNELFRLAKQTGTPMADLQQGFNDLIQSGLNWKESLQVIEATNKATAVTNAQVSVLTKGLSVAGAAYQFDLSKPQMAVSLLDKMVVAGRLGNAELESLSSIFARVGVNANSAGMGFDKTLAFIEGLSMIEREPERLATLADSTLRIFTNAKYMQTAAAATGVKFFDAKGARRDALDVLNDIKRRYDKLSTDAQRSQFVGKAFAGADLDTIKGLRTLLGGDMLVKVGKFNEEISSAAGTLDRDLGTAINNAVDQTGRLKATLREAADGFAKPINTALTKATQKLLNNKEDGGLGLDGKDLLAGAGAVAGATYLAKRLGGPLVKKLFGGAADIGQGVLTGKALEHYAGVTPVYVVNMPSSLGGSPASMVPDVAKKLPSVFKGLRAELAVLAASLAPYATRAGTAVMGAPGAIAAGTAAYGYGVYRMIDKLDSMMDQSWSGRDFSQVIADDARRERETFSTSSKPLFAASSVINTPTALATGHKQEVTTPRVTAAVTRAPEGNSRVVNKLDALLQAADGNKVGSKEKGDLQGSVKIEVVSSPEMKLLVRSMRSNSPSLRLDINRGSMGAFP